MISQPISSFKNNSIQAFIFYIIYTFLPAVAGIPERTNDIATQHITPSSAIKTKKSHYKKIQKFYVSHGINSAESQELKNFLASLAKKNIPIDEIFYTLLATLSQYHTENTTTKYTLAVSQSDFLSHFLKNASLFFDSLPEGMNHLQILTNVLTQKAHYQKFAESSPTDIIQYANLRDLLPILYKNQGLPKRNLYTTYSFSSRTIMRKIIKDMVLDTTTEEEENSLYSLLRTLYEKEIHVFEDFLTLLQQVPKNIFQPFCKNTELFFKKVKNNSFYFPLSTHLLTSLLNNKQEYIDSFSHPRRKKDILYFQSFMFFTPYFSKLYYHKGFPKKEDLQDIISIWTSDEENSFNFDLFKKTIYYLHNDYNTRDLFLKKQNGELKQYFTSILEIIRIQQKIEQVFPHKIHKIDKDVLFKLLFTIKNNNINIDPLFYKIFAQFPLSESCYFYSFCKNATIFFQYLVEYHQKETTDQQEKKLTTQSLTDRFKQHSNQIDLTKLCDFIQKNSYEIKNFFNE